MKRDNAIVLVNPLQQELKQPTAYIPLGLAYLASSLEQADVNVKIVNLADIEQTPEDVLSADVVGISVSSATYEQARQLVAFIRYAGPHFIILGGPHPSVLPMQTFDDLQPDAVIAGEAELMLSNFMIGQNKLSPVNDAGVIGDLNVLPFPARHFFKDEHVVDITGIHGQPVGVKSTTVLTSRGCPHTCAFCCKGHMMFKWHRWRSPENVKADFNS